MDARPSSSADMREQKTQSNMRHSPLLLLPSEIRNMVYDQVFSGEIVTVTTERTRLIRSEIRRAERYPYRSAAALLSTCRQIRYEASASFYRCSTFDLTASTRTAGHLNEFVSIVGPAKCRLMRFIRIQSLMSHQIDALLAPRSSRYLSIDYAVEALTDVEHVEIAQHGYCPWTAWEEKKMLESMHACFTNSELVVGFVNTCVSKRRMHLMYCFEVSRDSQGGMRENRADGQVTG